jgi:hypothetical protein
VKVLKVLVQIYLILYMEIVELLELKIHYLVFEQILYCLLQIKFLID